MRILLRIAKNDPIPESWRESDEGMEADFEKLTLSLTGVCNAKILDSSFESFRMESTASVNQRDLHRKPFMS
jgi:hypothetical protein